MNLILLLSIVCGADPSGAPEATVNGQTITTAEVDSAFQRTSVSKQPLDEAQKRMYRGHVLTVLIDNLLLKQFLDSESVAADPKAVEAHMAEYASALEKTGQSLEAFLKASGTSLEGMKREIVDLHQWFAYVHKQATEANLRDYFEANKSAFDGSQVRASHILVEFPPNPTVEQKELAHKKLEQIQMQLAGGTSFEDLAKKYSDCQSKANGGDVGFFPRKGRMTEPFAKAAFSMKVSEVSGIIETEYGYHLIRVNEHRPGKSVAFESALEDVKSLYAGDLRSAIIDAMRREADIKILQPAATAQAVAPPMR